MFERLRRQHYPAALNQIGAHLTLFHKLPPQEQIVERVHRAAHRPAFSLRVTGLRSLGRGVAFNLAADELMRLHAELSEQFEPSLTAQDRQRFWPHVVVQNKTTPEAARALLADLQGTFVPFTVEACGLTLWNYLGGPWERVGFFNFR